jgi:hypothetical protein
MNLLLTALPLPVFVSPMQFALFNPALQINQAYGPALVSPDSARGVAEI